MLRLDSSEMLPGSQKGEEKAGILKTPLESAILVLRTRCIMGYLWLERVMIT